MEVKAELWIPIMPSTPPRERVGWTAYWLRAQGRLSVSLAWARFRLAIESSWNVMAHGDAREGKWGGNWRMEWVASTSHTTSEHGVPSITDADAHTSTASSPLNWRPCRFKWTRPFRRKTKSGFCSCAITFQTQSTTNSLCHSDACAKAYFGPILDRWIRTSVPWWTWCQKKLCHFSHTTQTVDAKHYIATYIK